MGSTLAMDLAESVAEKKVDLWVAVRYHLTGNFYPPLPTSMTDACVRAIYYARKEQWDKRVRLPKGISYKGKYRTAPVSDIVEQHRLEFFLDN